MKFLLIPFLMCFYSLPQEDTHKIIWDADRKLRWEDFKGAPIQDAHMVASTSSAIHFGYSYTIKDNQVLVDYTVEHFFDTEESWFSPGRVNKYILAHEQTHFDISELHARILRKRLARKTFSKNVKPEIEAIYRQVDKERKAMQKKFDLESDHSRNEKNEMRWRKKIAQYLADHDEWK